MKKVLDFKKCVPSSAEKYKIWINTRSLSMVSDLLKVPKQQAVSLFTRHNTISISNKAMP